MEREIESRYGYRVVALKRPTYVKYIHPGGIRTDELFFVRFEELSDQKCQSG
jgi:hypothetical protein